MMDKIHIYKCLYISSIKSTAGKKIGFFLGRSSFVSAGASLWPKRSGWTT